MVLAEAECFPFISTLFAGAVNSPMKFFFRMLVVEAVLFILMLNLRLFCNFKWPPFLGLILPEKGPGAEAVLLSTVFVVHTFSQGV